MSKLGTTPHIRIFQDKDGQLYVLDQNTQERQLIPMRQNPNGTKVSRPLASEVEELLWNFRWDHKDSKKSKPVRERKAKVTKKTRPQPDSDVVTLI